MKDSIRKAQKRGLETEEQALQRKEIDRAYQSTKRAFKKSSIQVWKEKPVTKPLL